MARFFDFWGQIDAKMQNERNRAKISFWRDFWFLVKIGFHLYQNRAQGIDPVKETLYNLKSAESQLSLEKIVTFYLKVTNLARNEIWSEISFFPKNRPIFEIFESGAKIDFFSSIFWKAWPKWKQSKIFDFSSSETVKILADRWEIVLHNSAL